MGSALASNDTLPIQFWPLSKIMTRMAGWPQFTEDEQREFYISATDVITTRAKMPVCKEKWCQELLELRGPEIIISGMEKYKAFEVNIRSAMEFLIAACKKYDCVGVRALELDILDIIDIGSDIMVTHEEDEYIVAYQKTLCAILSEIALKVAHIDIDKNVKAFQCCEACGRPLDLLGHKDDPFSVHGSPPSSASSRRRNRNGVLEEGGIMVLVGDKTDSADLDEPIREQLNKVKSIVQNMGTFPREEKVQELGCTALLAAAKNGDSTALIKGNAVGALAAAITQFPESYGIVWKVCRAVSEMSNGGSAGIKSELGKKGLVAALVGVVDTFKDIEMKQLALFGLGACCDKGNNFERMYDLDLEKHIEKAREEYQTAKLHLHIPDPLVVLFDEYHKAHPELFKDAPKDEPEPVEKKTGNPWDPIKPPKAMYGTADALFEGGVGGLV